MNIVDYALQCVLSRPRPPAGPSFLCACRLPETMKSGGEGEGSCLLTRSVIHVRHNASVIWTERADVLSNHESRCRGLLEGRLSSTFAVKANPESHVW